MKQTIALNTPIAFDLWQRSEWPKTDSYDFLQRTVLKGAIEETAMAINEFNFPRGHLQRRMCLDRQSKLYDGMITMSEYHLLLLSQP